MSDYLLCYDITNRRRLGRVHSLLKKHAVPVQYSLFLFTGTDAQLQQCLDLLQAIMDQHTDDIRAYPLPRRGLRLVLGPSPLPNGIILSSLPQDWQPQELGAEDDYDD